MGELGVLPADFARDLAPLAGFGNILVHEYLRLDWDEVYRTLQQLEDLERFGRLVRHWLRDQSADSSAVPDWQTCASASLLSRRKQ
jgi:uncharacterized protein YutE (UPF0331/DUF86 family)